VKYLDFIVPAGKISAKNIRKKYTQQVRRRIITELDNKLGDQSLTGMGSSGVDDVTRLGVSPVDTDWLEEVEAELGVAVTVAFGASPGVISVSSS